MNFPTTNVISQGEILIYRIVWSNPLYFDKINIIRKTPQLTGIVGIYEVEKRRLKPIFFLECFRNGIRANLLDIADATDSKRTKHLLPLSTYIKRVNVFYRYTIIEDSILLNNVFVILVRKYHPKFNAPISDYPIQKHIKLIEEEIEI